MFVKNNINMIAIRLQVENLIFKKLALSFHAQTFPPFVGPWFKSLFGDLDLDLERDWERCGELESDLEIRQLGIEQEKANDHELDDLCEESGDESCEAGSSNLTRIWL